MINNLDLFCRLEQLIDFTFGLDLLSTIINWSRDTTTRQILVPWSQIPLIKSLISSCLQIHAHKNLDTRRSKPILAHKFGRQFFGMDVRDKGKFTRRKSQCQHTHLWPLHSFVPLPSCLSFLKIYNPTRETFPRKPRPDISVLWHNFFLPGIYIYIVLFTWLGALSPMLILIGRYVL